MKPYLIDVPVRLNIWIRPECQRRQFEVIKKVKPSILFLVSDGGRNEDEWRSIIDNRRIFDKEIDWECTVYKIYEDLNNGMYAMARKSHAQIWNTVDRCILLEDDILPSESFFWYCAELLEFYKDDERVNVICGMNHLGKCENVKSDYFFSRQGSIWGVATWKRTYDRFYDFAYGQDEYVMSLLKERTRHNRIFRNRVKTYASSEYCEGHVAAAEFFLEFGMYGQNQLQIIPKKNLVSNIGCTVQSTHEDVLKRMPRGFRRVFNMQIHEMEFPIKHAKYVIPDVNYEIKRNRIMGYNTSIIAAYRRIERLFLILKDGDLNYITKKIISRRTKYNER